MTNNPIHMICQQSLHLRYFGEVATVQQFSRELSRWCNRELLPALEALFDAFPVTATLRITHLEVDAGEVRGADWQRQLLRRVCESLHRQISAQLTPDVLTGQQDVKEITGQAIRSWARQVEQRRRQLGVVGQGLEAYMQENATAGMGKVPGGEYFHESRLPGEGNTFYHEAGLQEEGMVKKLEGGEIYLHDAWSSVSEANSTTQHAMIDGAAIFHQQAGNAVENGSRDLSVSRNGSEVRKSPNENANIINQHTEQSIGGSGGGSSPNEPRLDNNRLMNFTNIGSGNSPSPNDNSDGNTAQSRDAGNHPAAPQDDANESAAQGFASNLPNADAAAAQRFANNPPNADASTAQRFAGNPAAPQEHADTSYTQRFASYTASATSGPAAITANLELVMYYLQHGQLPWHATGLPGSILRSWLHEAVNGGLLFTEEGMDLLGNCPAALQRLLLQCAPDVVLSACLKRHTPAVDYYYCLNHVLRPLWEAEQGSRLTLAVIYELLRPLPSAKPLWQQWLPAAYREALQPLLTVIMEEVRRVGNVSREQLEQWKAGLQQCIPAGGQPANAEQPHGKEVFTGAGFSWVADARAWANAAKMPSAAVQQQLQGDQDMLTVAAQDNPLPPAVETPAASADKHNQPSESPSATAADHLAVEGRVGVQLSPQSTPQPEPASVKISDAANAHHSGPVNPGTAAASTPGKDHPAAAAMPAARHRPHTPPLALRLLPDEPTPDTGMYISTSGLVIVHAVIVPWLTELGLLINDQWRDAAAHDRAVMLLWYLCTGKCEAADYELALCKLLTGFPLNEPATGFIVPTPQEAAECMQVLQQVIDQWPVMKNTSVEGLRETFLYREGKLRQQDGKWLMQVASSPYDMLLQHIPWGFSIVRNSKMNALLFVEWA